MKTFFSWASLRARRSQEFHHPQPWPTSNSRGMGKMGGPGVECILEGVLEGNYGGDGWKVIGYGSLCLKFCTHTGRPYMNLAGLSGAPVVSILDVFCQSTKQKTTPNARSWAQFQGSRIFPNNIEQPQLGWCWFYPWHLFAQVDLAMVCELRPAWCKAAKNPIAIFEGPMIWAALERIKMTTTAILNFVRWCIIFFCTKVPVNNYGYFWWSKYPLVI